MGNAFMKAASERDDEDDEAPVRSATLGRWASLSAPSSSLCDIKPGVRSQRRRQTP